MPLLSEALSDYLTAFDRLNEAWLRPGRDMTIKNSDNQCLNHAANEMLEAKARCAKLIVETPIIPPVGVTTQQYKATLLDCIEELWHLGGRFTYVMKSDDKYDDPRDRQLLGDMRGEKPAMLREHLRLAVVHLMHLDTTNTPAEPTTSETSDSQPSLSSTTEEPPKEPKPFQPLVRLRGIAQKPLVDGQEVDSISEPRYKVIEALIKAGTDGLGKRELEEQSNGDAVKYLRALSKLPGWEKAICMAGKPWGRYAIRHE